MRKMIMVAGLALGAALVAGAPANAELGCQCVKIGAGPMCTKDIADCTFKAGGLCLAPCEYQAPKMKHKKKKA